MSPGLTLPPSMDWPAFDALQSDVERWRGVVAAIAAAYTPAAVQPTTAGSVLVGLVGRSLVVKLYPPFLRDHFEFEREALSRLHGRLGVPTPRLVDAGQRDGWPYLVMTQLAGASLLHTWPSLTEAQKCGVLVAIGKLAAEVHALPPGSLCALAPEWHAFLQNQRHHCQQRQQRTGLPAHLLAGLEAFIADELPDGPAVILTGEYTPMNLLHGPGGIVGMFDFGDGLVGPREYDWLGPLCFLAAGHAQRREAFFAGYGDTPGPGWPTLRLRLLRLLLLHRYSCLRAQVAQAGWQQAESFEALAEMIWP